MCIIYSIYIYIHMGGNGIQQPQFLNDPTTGASRPRRWTCWQTADEAVCPKWSSPAQAAPDYSGFTIWNGWLSITFAIACGGILTMHRSAHMVHFYHLSVWDFLQYMTGWYVWMIRDKYIMMYCTYEKIWKYTQVFISCTHRYIYWGPTSRASWGS